jgi:hypothetical protein
MDGSRLEALALHRIGELGSYTRQSLFTARLVWLSRVLLHQPNGDPARYVERLIDDFYEDTPFDALHEASQIIFEAVRRPFDGLDDFLAALNEQTSQHMMRMAPVALRGYVRLLGMIRAPHEVEATATVLGRLLGTPQEKAVTWVLTNYKPLRNEAGEDEFGRIRITELAELFGVAQPRTITQSNSRVARDIRKLCFELGEGRA